VQLTDALARQIGKVPFHGFRFSANGFDCGSKIGFLQANIAFAMLRDDLAEPLASWIKNSMAYPKPRSVTDWHKICSDALRCCRPHQQRFRSKAFT